MSLIFNMPVFVILKNILPTEVYCVISNGIHKDIISNIFLYVGAVSPVSSVSVTVFMLLGTLIWKIM